MALEKFVYSSAGYIEIMKSSGVRSDLQSRAERVRAHAEAELVGEDVQLIADTTVGRTRAGATVIGVPMRLEVERRILGRAIDAAR